MIEKNGKFFVFPTAKKPIVVTSCITVHCSQCGKDILASLMQLGREIRCPHCRKVTTLEKWEKSFLPKEMTAEELKSEPEQDTLRRKLSRVEEVDMTPMIDVTFLLLIFFMVTAAFSLQRSLEIPPPDGENESQSVDQIVPNNQTNNSVIVRITKDNTIWVEDREVPSRQELLAVLRDMTNTQEQIPPVTTMLVLTDGYARHETVVMVLDAGNAVSMKSIQLKTEWEE